MSPSLVLSSPDQPSVGKKKENSRKHLPAERWDIKKDAREVFIQLTKFLTPWTLWKKCENFSQVFCTPGTEGKAFFVCMYFFFTELLPSPLN